MWTKGGGNDNHILTAVTTVKLSNEGINKAIFNQLNKKKKKKLHILLQMRILSTHGLFLIARHFLVCSAKYGLAKMVRLPRISIDFSL